jgi:hypothetical protein
MHVPARWGGVFVNHDNITDIATYLRYVVQHISASNRTRIPCGHLTGEHFGENSVDTLERRWEVLVKMREQETNC